MKELEIYGGKKIYVHRLKMRTIRVILKDLENLNLEDVQKGAVGLMLRIMGLFLAQANQFVSSDEEGKQPVGFDDLDAMDLFAIEEVFKEVNSDFLKRLSTRFGISLVKDKDEKETREVTQSKDTSET